MIIHFQARQGLQRAATLEITTVSPIFHIHCYRLLFYAPLGFGGLGGGVGLTGGGFPFTLLGGGGGGGGGLFAIFF